VRRDATRLELEAGANQLRVSANSPTSENSSFELSFLFSTGHHFYLNDVNHHRAAASCSCQSVNSSTMVSSALSSFIPISVMTNIQPQTRVFDPQGNETFVTRQSELHIILLAAADTPDSRPMLTFDYSCCSSPRPPAVRISLRSPSPPPSELFPDPDPVPEHWL
jgi:hypothetical protein